MKTPVTMLNYGIIRGTKYRSPGVLAGTRGVAREDEAPMHNDSTTPETIPYGYCHCGCGKQVPIARKTANDRGHVKGQPILFCKGHHLPIPLADRFWPKVDKSGGSDACWIWQASQMGNGYGQFNRHGPGSKRAHRIAYELTHGPVPDGMMLDHLCRNRMCVNPKHLEPVTPRENFLRGESPSAQIQRTGICKHGHEFSEENTYMRTLPNGEVRRRCRACGRERDSKRRPRKSAGAKP